MDNNLSTNEQTFQIEQIKVEVLQTEDDVSFGQEEQYEPSIHRTIKIEESDLEVSKYKLNTNDKIFTNNFSTTYDCNHQDNSDKDPYQFDTTTVPQDMLELCTSDSANFDISGFAEAHSDNKLYKCNQTGCSKLFETKWKLNIHMSIHGIEKPYECPQPGCEKLFKRKDQVISHMRVHSDQKLFKCNQTGCAMSFKRKNELSKHIKVHTDERPFKCNQNECTKSFKTNYGLKVHSTVHSTVPMHKCTHEGCGKAYHWKNLLIEHQRIHALNIMVCDYPGCNTTFRWTSSYYKHKRTHKIDGRLRCPFKKCEETFVNNNELEQHIQVHKGVRPSCSNITSNSNRVVKSELSLKLDSEMPDELRNVYKCSKCDEVFDEEKEFQEHTRCCKKYSRFAFVDVDQIMPDDTTTEIKTECGNIE